MPTLALAQPSLLLAPLWTLLSAGSMVVNDLSRVDSAADSDVLQMTVGGGLTVQQSLVEAGYLQVTAPQSVTVGQLAYLRFAFTLRMSVGSLTLSNSECRIRWLCWSRNRCPALPPA